MQIGLNLSPVSDHSREFPFADLLKCAESRTDGTLTVGTEGGLPGGLYVAQGDVSQVQWHRRAVQDSAPLADMALIRVPMLAPDGGTPIDTGIRITGPQAALDSLKLWMPGVDTRQTFHPQYVERLKPFKVLRFMEWQRINEAAGEFPQIEDRQSGSGGVAPGLIFELHTTPWVCLHHEWDRARIQDFAAWWGGGAMYLEISNEFWNRAFPQNAWLRARAGADSGPLLWRAAAQAMTDAWAAFPGADTDYRIVRTLAWQTANPVAGRAVANYVGKGNFDALSCAGYFGIPVLDEPQLSAATTVDEVLDRCEANLRNKLLPRLGAYKEIADDFVVPLVLYEVGQHLVAKGNPWQPVYHAVQTHLRMGDLYRVLLSSCRDLGIDLVCMYRFCGPSNDFGSWGLLDHQWQKLSEKWGAVKTFTGA